MQFSVKTLVAFAIGMASLASAAPQGATVDPIVTAAPAEASVTVTEVNVNTPSSTITEVIPEPTDFDPALTYRCCAFQGCKVCADYGHIDSCSPCGGAYPWCCYL